MAQPQPHPGPRVADGTPCTPPCRALRVLCDLKVCQQPWAVAYRRQVSPKWWERLLGTLAAFLMGSW